MSIWEQCVKLMDIAAEVRHRVSKANLAYRQVRKPTMKNRHLSMDNSLQLLDALVPRVMLHGAGNWPLLSHAQLRQLTAPYMRRVRSIVGNGFWAPDQLTDMQLQFQLGCPSILLRLAKMRLLFAFHLFQDAPTVIVDLVTGVASEQGLWFMALRHASAWVVTMDNTFFPAHPHEASVEFICHWFHDHRVGGSGQIRRLYRRALHQGRVVGDAWAALLDLKNTLTCGGVVFPAIASEVSCYDPPDVASFECRWCAKHFPTRRQWQNHLWSAHGALSLQN